MEQIKENKLGSQPIRPLVVSMSIPIMISMLTQALYNIVDSIYLATYGGDDYVTALSFVMPVQFMMTSVAVGTSVGMGSLLSLFLGQGKKKEAEKAGANGLILLGLSSLIFVIMGLFFTENVMSIQTNSARLIELSSSYSRIVTIFSTFLFIQIGYERILQSTGNSLLSMAVQGTGALLNIGIAPIFIFGYFGVPELGINGAAYAAVISQCTAAVTAYVITKIKVKEVRLRFKDYRLKLKIVKDIYRVGFPTIIVQSLGSIMLYVMNIILNSSPQSYAWSLGIYYKIQSFLFMPVFGLNSGLVPIISYNFGAKNPQRIKSAIKIGTTYALTIMIIGTILLMIFAENLVLMFNPSEASLKTGVDAIRIISITYFMSGIILCYLSVFQALRKAGYSLILASLRQLILLIPFAFIIVNFIDVKYVWYAFIAAEVPAFILSVILLKKIVKKVIDPLETNENPISKEIYVQAEEIF